MKFIITAVLLLFSTLATALDVEKAKIDFSAQTYQPLAKGFQGMLTGEAVRLTLPTGTSVAYFYQLPEYNDIHTVVLQSTLKAGAVFYPVVAILDREFNVKRVIKPHARIESLGMNKFGFDLDFPIWPDEPYMVLTTDPELLDQQGYYTSSTSAMTPVYLGTTTVYVQGSTQEVLRRGRLTTEPHVQLMLPYEGNARPYVRQQGWLFEFGVTTGGDKVYANPDGDPYNVGGGAIVGLGYAQQLFDSPHWLSRYSLGMRYQGGQGSSSGVVFKSGLVYAYRHLNIGAGVYVDLFNESKSIMGETTGFDDSVGGMVFVELRASDYLNIGLQYIDIDYKSQEGVPFDGRQLGISLTFMLR